MNTHYLHAQSPDDSQALSRVAAHDQDAVLIEGLRMQEIAAFADMVKRYERPLLSVALRITANREDAEEVVQDSFLRVFQHIESFRGESLFRTWLTRIARNEALMKIRGKAKTHMSLDDDQRKEWSAQPRELKANGYTPEESYSLQELHMIALRLSSSMRGPSQQLMRLCIEMDLSTSEIGKILGLTSSTVKSRLHRARQKLRNAMYKHCVSANWAAVRTHVPLRQGASQKMVTNRQPC